MMPSAQEQFITLAIGQSGYGRDLNRGVPCDLILTPIRSPKMVHHRKATCGSFPPIPPQHNTPFDILLRPSCRTDANFPDVKIT
jgi:hypothetical protein